jgi:hypothetical protein
MRHTLIVLLAIVTAGIWFLAGCSVDPFPEPDPAADSGMDAGSDGDSDTESTDTGNDTDTGTASDGGADGGADGGDTGGDTDTAGFCPEPIAETCTDGPADLPVLLHASDLGEDVRFVALGYGALLAIRESAAGDAVVLFASPVGILDDPFQWILANGGTAELSVADAGAVEAVGAVNRPGGDFDFDQVALVCIDGVCALYGADIPVGGSADLVPIDNGTVPCTGEVRGLWSSTSGILCAYGSGICCFDGSSWSTVVEPWEGAPTLNHMPRNHWLRIAVGDKGRVAREASPDWLDSSDPGYPDLLTVAVDQSAALPAGEGGVLFNPEQMANPCVVADEDIVNLSAFPQLESDDSEELRGVTASGTNLHRLGAAREALGSVLHRAASRPPARRDAR